MPKTTKEYNPKFIEMKWQRFWEENKTFKLNEHLNKENFYVLDMFPYPSGSGLHVGHVEGYTGSDIIARYKRMNGFNVLHPMGWDAFGLPAEQHALETGGQPSDNTIKNINNYRRQLKSLGFSYDWDREINTTDPMYYKWTQWIFIQLYNRGLAYIDEAPVNWCPALRTVLANEEVIDGKSERGGHQVIRKSMRQWMLKITEYAERLLVDLEELDWDESIKEMQRNWIGRSEGAEIQFPINGHQEKINVFTTRPDTLFGVTYCVLAPENPLVVKITTVKQKDTVFAYKKNTAHKSDLERTDLAKEKTGVFTGCFAINPVNGAKIPIWIADYVLVNYGTGAIMGVPGHDKRDHEFARKYALPIISVVAGSENIKKEAYMKDGPHINSKFLNGLYNKEATSKIIDWLEDEGKGTKKVIYRLRDWLFSRQRYWGEPIPILHLEDGTMKPVPLSELPLQLPAVDVIKPSGTGESPLANITEWVNTVDSESGMSARRETNTMPQWAGSCWYYLRFIDPHNQKELCSKEKAKEWLPVDLYIGGAEHAVLHLLYSRFWHKVLYDLGLVTTKEPFQKLSNQGIILGENNERMSKSRGNVVNPDEIIESHGADTLRLYEMFMGPFEATKPWGIKGLDGAYKFLQRIWRLFIDEGNLSPKIQDGTAKVSEEFIRVWHQTIKKVTEDIENLRFNTAISQLMIFINECYKQETLPKKDMEYFVKMLSPIAPHLSEELWFVLGHTDTISYETWPNYEEGKLEHSEVEIVVQFNGKIKARMKIPINLSKKEIKKIVMESSDVKAQFENNEIKQVIIVPNKLVNFVFE